ncbi:hypothetical protein LFZ5_11200 [Salmonella enterica subsp. enterica serovar Apapa str. SA20060561]|uniref:hypothetical protein n=1 Tax=Salmonella enterica TaxID=28901 RepID=UPI0009735162|nr:hypothetical protein [Salmonella enterica]EHY9749914.1 hypothetical protein [Salmonella enterica subsp. enterica serovar Lattenkamp]STB59332.1 Uncharacterised protein [Citrobacter freundii]APY32540.1 hypothetical protein LFZ5_11200 [Salmonella enterica subsp. enterica serovar Apapa str. SA20060561]EJD3717132.1 hypothetical protein [Salmonella enterica]EKQ2694613.1 hypothetical protein [Salmonella enterica]
MQQNNQLTNDRLAHVYRNLKRWAEHDNALNSYISGQKIDPIFHDCVVALAELQERRAVDKQPPVAWTDAEELRDMERDGYGAMLSLNRKDCEHADPRRQILLFTHPAPLRNAEMAELQERRKADSESVSFDALNAAVAEVTGGNQHIWNAAIYKGHHPVPFMNYNSLARIVDKYRAPQPAPVVPEEIDVNDPALDTHRKWMAEGWNRCRSAMLQAKPANTKGPDHAND